MQFHESTTHLPLLPLRERFLAVLSGVIAAPHRGQFWPTDRCARGRDSSTLPSDSHSLRDCAFHRLPKRNASFLRDCPAPLRYGGLHRAPLIDVHYDQRRTDA
ncbi:hypothetical protein NN3_00320 [Nocardia neocaledoniensis NBRC 108232]|nr:hypothetical protein NN3_00320 [Nocardia neocaledoniensis NBRC 108232]